MTPLSEAADSAVAIVLWWVLSGVLLVCASGVIESFKWGRPYRKLGDSLAHIGMILVFSGALGGLIVGAVQLFLGR